MHGFCDVTYFDRDRGNSFCLHTSLLAPTSIACCLACAESVATASLACVGNRRARRLRRLVFLTNFDFAAQNRALFDDDATRLHIASNTAGVPDLDAFAGGGTNFLLHSRVPLLAIKPLAQR